MSELEDDLKRVLRERADGDYLTGPDAMLGQVHVGAKRLRRRRTAMTGMAALALVTAGTGLALGGGNLMNSNPPVVAPSTATPSMSPTPATVAPNQPTGTVPPSTTNLPPVQGSPVQTGSQATKQVSSTGPTQPSAPFVRFQVTAVAARGSTTMWVLGKAQCDGEDCYPVLKSTDGGGTFRHVGTVPANVEELRFDASGREGWAWGDAGSLWETHDGGETWLSVPDLPGTILGGEPDGTGMTLLITGPGGRKLWERDTGVDRWYRKDEHVGPRIDDFALWGRYVIVVDDAGQLAVVTSNSDHKPRRSGCVTTSQAARVSVAVDAVWLLCPTPSGTRVLLSTDAGRTWRQVTSFPRINYDTQLAARSGSSLAVTNGSGTVTFVSSGGGTRTVRIAGLTSPHYIRFQTSEVGYIVDTDNQLFRTGDGGGSWTEVRFPGFE